MNRDPISHALNSLIISQQGLKGIAAVLTDREPSEYDAVSLGFAVQALAEAIQVQTNIAMESWEQEGSSDG